jgi:hypothetical protein
VAALDELIAANRFALPFDGGVAVLDSGGEHE